MNILITGASGWIGAQIASELIASGHQITCCVRNARYTQNLFPNARVIECDFNNDTAIATWLPRLTGIDVVINTVGIFSHPQKKIIWAIHYDTPKALFAACAQLNIKKVIQISALGVENVKLDYAESKKAADEYLLTLSIPAIILRPSLVYGHSSYGGMSLFRGMASLPYIIPVPGKGDQLFQPIHVKDLTKAIAVLIHNENKTSVILPAVSAERISLREVLMALRAWLGFRKAYVLPIPLWLIHFFALIGNLIPYSTLNITAYKMLNRNNITTEKDTQDFFAAIHFIPRTFKEGVFCQPSSMQDRWHARLFFLKPLLKLSIAFIWLMSGITSAFLYPQSLSYELLQQVGITGIGLPIMLYGASALNIVLGLSMFTRFKKYSYLLQLLTILIYTIIISIFLPQLWLEPFGPIAKNIPIFIAILILMAIDEEK